MTSPVYNLVAAAAREMVLAGEEPKYSAIRAKVPKGSNTTIREGLRRFYAGLGEELGAGDDIPDEVRDFCLKARKSAFEHAEEQYAELKNEANEKVEKAEKMLKAQDEQLDLLISESHEDKATISDLQETIDSLREQLHAAETQRMTMIAKLDSLQEKNNACEKSFSELRNSFEKRLEELTERADKQEIHFLKQIGDIQSQLHAEKKEHVKAEKNHMINAKKQKEKCEKIEQEKIKLIEKNGTLTAKLNEANKESETLRRELAATVRNVQKMERSNSDKDQQINELSERIGDLVSHLSKISSNVEQLTSREANGDN